MVVQTLGKNRYRLLEELGKGGMGVVYRAHDSLLEREVAIKLLNSSDLGPESKRRLLHEAQAAAKLNHPNIVSIYDAGEEDNHSFIIMELLKGSSLYDHKPGSLTEIIDIIRQICNALEHAHTHGIIHRDLKPENVIIDQSGLAKLTDFGLSRSLTSRISVEGAIMGTVLYMAPEQALGQPIDGRTDLYALGALMYELITGKLPFSAEDPLAVISQHLYAPIIPPSNYRPDIPPALDILVTQLLSKHPEERPESAAAVRACLDPEALTTEVTPKDRSDLETLVRGRLVGRDGEIALAKRLWRQIAFGQPEKPIFLISGELGVGKTALVREIKAFVEISGGRTLTGICYEEGSAPYTPVVNIIRTAFQIPGIQLHDLAIADLLTIAPELRTRYPQAIASQTLNSPTDQLRLLESITTLFIELTTHSPLLVVIEDIQWADGGTLAFLRHLARRIKASRLSIMILTTNREDELEAVGKISGFIIDLNHENLLEQINLKHYNPEQTRELLNVMFQDEVTRDFQDAIYQETEGNLFFIEEICKALIEHGKLYRKDGVWQYPSLDHIQLPQSVRLTIQARLNKLPQDTRNVLMMASVIGRKFDFETLRKASELDEDMLIEALENAQYVQLISEVETNQYRRSPKSSEEFVFAHGLIATTMRESVSSLRLHRLHKRVAEAIESLRTDDYAVLAYHYERANDPVQACLYYMKAGERALEVYANQEAETYFRAAEDLTQEEEKRANSLAGIGEALFRQSLYKNSIQSWKSAIGINKILGNHDQVARLYSRAARAAWYAGDPPEGLTLCLEGLRFVPDDYHSPGTAALIHETARAYFFNKKPDEALPLCRRALEMAIRLDLPEVQAETLATLGVLPNQTLEEKKIHLLRAIEIAEKERLWVTAARAHLNMGGQLQEFGDMRAARAHFLNAYEFANKVGNYSWAHDFLAAACEASMDMGDFDFAEETLAKLPSLLESIPNRENSLLYDCLLEIQLDSIKGQWEKSLAHIKEHEQAVADTMDKGIKMRFEIIRANSLMETGSVKEAIQVLQQVIRNPEVKIEELIPIASFLTRAYILDNDITSAEHLLQRVAVDNKNLESNLRVVHILYIQAQILSAKRDFEKAVNTYSQLLDLLNRCTLRWIQGLVYMGLAETLASRGMANDFLEARSNFTLAAQIFREIKAPGYEALVKNRQQEMNYLRP